MAFNEKKTDIYEIIFLKKDKIDKKDRENQMFDSIKEAKKNMERILQREKNDDIINSHDSIIIEQNDEI